MDSKKGIQNVRGKCSDRLYPFFYAVEKFPFIEKNVKTGYRPCFDFFKKIKMKLRKRKDRKTVLRLKSGLCQPGGQRRHEKNVMIPQGIMAFFNSTNSWIFLIPFLLFYFKTPSETHKRRTIRCRSPTIF